MGKMVRNEKCRCGRGKKYKNCCMDEDQKKERISVYTRFSVIKDPQHNRRKRYFIMDLLIMVIYGILNQCQQLKK